MNVQSRAQIAVLDDYGGAARTMADWSAIDKRADVTVFADHVSGDESVVERLAPFDAVCVMRERTPLTRAIIGRLPRLRLIASTGSANASIDMAAALEHNIRVTHTGYTSHGAIELTWALILAAVRRITAEAGSLRAGGWQTGVGGDLNGRTLGVAGLGRIGSKCAHIAQAFGMNVVAWSENLTEERAVAAGARLVNKETLLREADILSVHLVLSERSRGTFGSNEFARMKPTAWFVNTSRGPLVDESALIDALVTQQIAGAALDTFATEPLPADHPFRTLPNVIATPHVGFVTQQTYETFFGDTVVNLTNWLNDRDSAPT